MFFFFLSRQIYLFLAKLNVGFSNGVAWVSHGNSLSCCRALVVGCTGLSSPVACGIFQDQGTNPCPLHWQADS